jgi:hypothetical protein
MASSLFSLCTNLLLNFNRKKPRLKPILSVGVMDRLQIDLKEFTFYQEWNDEYSYLLTVIDHFSGYPWAFPLFTKTAQEVSYHLINLFFMFGPPRYPSFLLYFF